MTSQSLTQGFSYLTCINDMLKRPTTGFAAAEAAFRVNTDLSTYYTQVPINRTPFLKLPVGTRSGIRSAAQNYESTDQTIDPVRALYVATCVAILRGEAERLQPPAVRLASSPPLKSATKLTP